MDGVQAAAGGKASDPSASVMEGSVYGFAEAFW